MAQYIVIRGALSADTVSTLLAVANEMKRLGKGEKPKGFQNDQHALHWHRVYRDLIDHPLVSPILVQLCGSAFRLDHVNVHARPATFPGGHLHGGDNPGGGNGFFGFRNGNFANGLVSVTYELEDTDCNPAGGGFCCACYPCYPCSVAQIIGDCDGYLSTRPSHQLYSENEMVECAPWNGRYSWFPQS